MPRRDPSLRQDARWRERADELGRFNRENGRWPRVRSADPGERSLARWRGTQLDPSRAVQVGVDGFDRHAYLERAAPGWRERAPHFGSRRSLDQWKRRVDELGLFKRDHGRWPQKRSDDPAEQSLAHWRKNQRMSVRKEEARYGTSDRRAYLDQVAPGWSASRWEERADELGCFTRDHGRRPRQYANDPAERSLARWLRDQRAEAKDVTRSAGGAERHEYLDRVAPGWASTVRWDSWLERADALREFHREHGRWPSFRSNNPHELSLADWQLRQRAYVAQGANAQAAARRQHLDAIVPGWEGRGLIPWEAQAAELAGFVAHHQRWPSPTGPEAGERRLAEWRKVQRLKLHRSDAGPTQRERRAVLDRTVQGWAVARAGSPLGG